MLHDRVLKRQEVLEVFNARYAAALASAHGTISQVVMASLKEFSSGLIDRKNRLAREIDAARDLFYGTPGYVRVEQQISNWIIHVPFYTDIQDNAFVQSAKRAMEDTWHLRSGEDDLVAVRILDDCSAHLWSAADLIGRNTLLLQVIELLVEIRHRQGDR